MAGANVANVINSEIENYVKGGAITTLFDRDDTFYSTIEKRPVGRHDLAEWPRYLTVCWIHSLLDARFLQVSLKPCRGGEL